MDKANERISVANRALAAFNEVMQIKHPSSIERDAAIQRFEFTFEACWKAAKVVLYVYEGLDIGSPKGIVRACRDIGVLTDEQTVTALKMVDDRNLTSHTYNESLAVQICSRLPLYQQLLSLWLEKLTQLVASE